MEKYDSVIEHEAAVVKRIESELIRKGYHRSQIKLEYHFFVGNSPRAADIVVLNSQNNPVIIFEIKVKVLREPAIEQLKSSLRATGADYGVITDGSESIVLRQLKEEPYFISLPELPTPDEKIGIINKKKLKPIPIGSNVFWEITNILREESVSSRQQLQILLTIIVAKVYDERFSKTTKFCVSFSNDKIDSAETNRKFAELVQLAIKKYQLSDFLEEKIMLKEKTVVQIVSLLQEYSLSSKESNTSGPLSQILTEIWRETGFFDTPDLVVNLILNLIKIDKNQTIFDARTGSGAFLVKAHKKFKVKNLFGNESNLFILGLTKINFILNGLKPSRISFSVFNSKHGPKIDSQRTFDLVFCNPPIGAKTLEETQLSGKKQDSEVQFLEESKKLVKEGGQLAIILPEKLLFHEKYAKLREEISNEMKILAIINLPTPLLKNFPHISMNLLILKKEKPAIEQETLLAKFDSITVFDGENSIDTSDIIEKNYFDFLKGKKIFLRKPLIYTTKTKSLKQWGVIANDPTYEKLKSKILEKADKIVKLGDICEIKGGVSYPPQKVLTEGTPYIRIQDLFNEKIYPKTFVSPDNINPGLRIKEKDILISVKGTIGKIALATKIDVDSIASSGIYTLRLKNKELETAYLLLALKSRFVQEQLKKITQGATIQYVSINDLRGLEIPLISVQQQKELFSKLKEINSKIVTLQKEKEQLEEQAKKSVNFLTGDLFES